MQNIGTGTGNLGEDVKFRGELVYTGVKFSDMFCRFRR
jgi:hypothetical protein